MRRVLTALVLSGPAVGIIFYGHRILIWAVVAVLGSLCLREFVRVASHHGWRVPVVPSLAGGALILTLPAIDPVVFLFLAMAGLTLALRETALEKALPVAACFLLGVVYCYGPWRCALALRELNPHWLLFALALNWIGDAAAYVVGSRIGRHKLVPPISPGKSWEGAVAALVFSSAFGIAYLAAFLPSLPLAHRVILPALASVVGQVGDLAESAFKRGAGIKDSGQGVPGHGGWLDRLDSSLFALPVVYLWATSFWVR